MAKRLLDTSVLVSYWHHRAPDRLETVDTRAAQVWADDLIRFQGSDLIVTPVYVEFLAGVRTSHEMRLAAAYLARFRVLDGGSIPNRDWEEAKRLAARVPRDGKPRQLGDCLIRAIANRLNCEVLAIDKRFLS
jgi:predicted nucleic acid-binding protein